MAMAATILIVEDEHAVARGIQYALQQEGYTVALARSGEEGLEIAIGQAPDTFIYWTPSVVGALLWPWLFVILRDVRRRGRVT